MPKKYREEELRFFRLLKAVKDYSARALRFLFKEKWDKHYPATPWENDRASGKRLLDECWSRHYDPPSQSTTKNLAEGDVEEWDITTLYFAVKLLHDLHPSHSSDRRKTINEALYEIKAVRNYVAHAKQISISGSDFEKHSDTLLWAFKKLLRKSDPLIKKLKRLKNETIFQTDDLLKYKRLLKDARSATRISQVDMSPSKTRPDILDSNKYIEMMKNLNNYRPYEVCWEELKTYFNGLLSDVDIDMKLYAKIEWATTLFNHGDYTTSEALEVLNSLIPDVYRARNCLVILARIKIRKGLFLCEASKIHDGMYELRDAEQMLSLTKCHHDIGEVNTRIAGYILEPNLKTIDDAKQFMDYFEKGREFYKKVPTDKIRSYNLSHINFLIPYYQRFYHDLNSPQGITDKTLESCREDLARPLGQESFLNGEWGMEK